mmetsp:Transcript_17481/g.37780  ORF Transcript_17481/g.37780 Transcript_17481/m.37780 type:complete len:799 (-) Transcript_17481:259-2655(-)
MNMLSAARSKAGCRTPLLASLAVASVVTAFTCRRKEECETDKVSDGENAAPSCRYFDEWLDLHHTEALSAESITLPPLSILRNSRYCSCESKIPFYNRQRTQRLFDRTSSNATLESRYKVDWNAPLGEGGYGAVYICTERKTGERHALKMIPKEFTDEESFQKEIDALMRVRLSGSHPNICRLKENFDQRGNFYLVMDLISGGEMFDHLADNGPYSEADAARLVMETASALAFLHGVGLVHADLKPENLMLSERNRSSSVIKLVDFGCSEFYKGDVDYKQIRTNTSTTPAYSPPEAFGKWKGPLSPSFDMHSLGCIIYIMLTGRHPFDIEGGSTDEEMKYRIKNEMPPLRNSDITAHLSESAIDLIEKLLDKRPRRRMTAMRMLDHPWVKGQTATRDKIEDSDKRLKVFKKFKSRLEVKVFSDWITGSTSDDAKTISLMERAFKSLDTHKKGFVTTSDLRRSFTGKDEKPPGDEDAKHAPLDLSGFSDLISDNMVSKYYPQGYNIYKEGSKGDSIYFLNSGTVEVSNGAGFKTTLSQGELFGEGALLDSKGRRNATIRCVTPVHAIRISKEYFQKYMQSVGGSEILITLREQDRARDRDRDLKILRLQKNLFERDFSKGDVLFSCGDDGRSLFIIENGEIEIKSDTGKHILNIEAGSICGEHSLITGQPRNVAAVCSSDKCKVYEMAAKDFFALYKSSSSMTQSVRDICFRRDVQKAISKKLGTDFSTNVDDVRKAFDAVDLDKNGVIDLEEVKALLRSIYPSLSDDDPLFSQVLQSLDIDGNSSIEWEEYKKIFLKE